MTRARPFALAPCLLLAACSGGAAPAPLDAKPGPLLASEAPSFAPEPEHPDPVDVPALIRGTAPVPYPLPADERVRHVAWLRRLPGVDYSPLVRVTGGARRAVQSFPAAWSEAQRAGAGHLERAAHGTVYVIDRLDPGSRLAKLALRAGDRVLAINGLPIGNTVTAGKQLFALLRNDRRFAILLERRGRRVVVPVEASN